VLYSAAAAQFLAWSAAPRQWLIISRRRVIAVACRCLASRWLKLLSLLLLLLLLVPTDWPSVHADRSSVRPGASTIAPLCSKQPLARSYLLSAGELFIGYSRHRRRWNGFTCFVFRCVFLRTNFVKPTDGRIFCHGITPLFSRSFRVSLFLRLSVMWTRKRCSAIRPVEFQSDVSCSSTFSRSCLCY